MSQNKDINSIVEMLLEFKGEKIKQYCQNKLDQGFEPLEILEGLSLGLEEIGKEGFTSDLIVTGNNLKKAIKTMRPFFKKSDTQSKGKVVVGSVKGDVHDIGKEIFSITLVANGFEVIDLGVDVSKEIFIQKIKETNPDILGLSSLLTTTVFYMEEVVTELKKENLMEKVKVIIGGKSVTEAFAKKIGVVYGKDGIDGLNKCLALIGD